MKKKILTIAFVLLFAVSSIFASVNFVFGKFTMHPDLLLGFVPLHATAGVEYDGISLIDGSETSFRILAGGGYTQRKVWQNPDTGAVIKADPVVYDAIDLDWSLSVKQDFLPNDDDRILEVSLSYNGQFDKAVDSVSVGKVKKNGGEYAINTLAGYGIGDNYRGTTIPEINGNKQFLGTQFALSFKVAEMVDDIHTNDGYSLEAEALWAPSALNKALDGYADYYAFTLNAISAKTLYKLESNDATMLSIVAINRTNIKYIGGKAVPMFFQEPNSLGRRVRGFTKGTYNSEFSIVSNSDIRFAGPFIGVDGIAPRINIFYDFGYGFGKVLNTDVKEKYILSSAGVQATVTLADGLDLGYQFAYLFEGENYAKGKSGLVGSMTIFLDF